MYNVKYTGSILVSENIDNDLINFPFEVVTNGPVTEANLKVEVLKQVPLCYTCIKSLTYSTSINYE